MQAQYLSHLHDAAVFYQEAVVAKLDDIRRRNFKKLVDEYGATTLAKRLGWSGPSYVSQLLSGTRPLSEKTTRKIESTLGLEDRSLDGVVGDATPFSGLDIALFAESLRALDEAIEDLKAPLPRPKYADLLKMIYEDAVKAGRVDRAQVNKLVKLIK